MLSRLKLGPKLLLAPGGVLLYATCSILDAENAGQVEGFLARTPDAQVEPLDARFGRVAGPGRQRLPGEADGDGFYYARVRRLAGERGRSGASG